MRHARNPGSTPPGRRVRARLLSYVARAARPLFVGALAFVLAGCPEERPGATREIPPQRVPPAMPLEPQPAPTIGPRRPDGAAATQSPAEGAARSAPTTPPAPGRSDAR